MMEKILLVVLVNQSLIIVWIVSIISLIVHRMLVRFSMDVLSVRKVIILSIVYV